MPSALPSDPTTTNIGLSRSTILPSTDGSPTGAPLLDPERPRFQTVSQIGIGGIGEVLSARDVDIGRRVAIKRIRPDRRTEAAFARFVQEVRTVGRLDHPNIVPIHDVGRDADGGYYFVMKYVDGETLEDVLGRLRAGDPGTHRRWTFERRTELFLQILQAVDFAHTQGVLHRDLKPANVMVGDYGEVQLVDWGVAKQFVRPTPSVREFVRPTPSVPELDPAEEPDLVVRPTSSVQFDELPAESIVQTQHGALVGTPRYMAPEQARGEPVDVRTETWTLSLLFYELLSLRHPMDGIDDVGTVLEAIQTAPIDSLRTMKRHRHQSAVPHDLAWIAMDGLERDPAKRYQTVGEIIERLHRRYDGHVAIQCPATLQKSMLLTLATWVDRNPTATTLGLMAIVALGVATVILLLGGGATVIGLLGALLAQAYA